MKSLSKTEWLIAGITIIGVAVVLNLGRKAMMPEPDDAPAEEAPHNAFAELQKRDQELTERPGTRVTREDTVLHVKTTGAQTVDFKDCLDCGPEKEVEHYVVDDSAHGILIYRLYYEGDDFAYIAPDTQKYDLAGYPVFSPNGKAFVIVSDSEQIGHSQVDLWTFEGSTPKKVFQQDAKQDDIFRLSGWDGDDKIHLEETQNSDEGTFCITQDLVHQGETWTLLAPSQQLPGPCSDKQDWLPPYLQMSSM